MKKLRVIQIGTRHAHAIGALQALRELNDTFELVAIGEPDEEQRKKILNDPAYKDLYICSAQEAFSIENIDAAIIETDEHDLTKYALMAAKKGLHIQMDKPGGESVEEFKELICEVKSRNLIFQPGYMYRFNPAIVKTVEMVNNGELGEIFSVEAQMSIDNGEGFDAYMSKYKGGITYFLGCQLADVVYKICGNPENIIPLNRSDNGADCINFGMAAYEYKNGVSFIKTVGNEINGFLRRQIVVTGSLGSVEIKPIEQFLKDDPSYLVTSMRVLLKKDAESAHFDHTTVIDFPKYKRYDDMFLNFAALIDGKGVKWNSYDEELEVFKLLMKSCDKGGK